MIPVPGIFVKNYCKKKKTTNKTNIKQSFLCISNSIILPWSIENAIVFIVSVFYSSKKKKTDSKKKN